MQRITLQDFLVKYKDVLSKSGLEAITGINQKQLWHYANGTSKPSKKTIQRFQLGIKEFAQGLCDAIIECKWSN